MSPARGLSHVSNAQRHCGAHEIAILDIAKYYASTQAARVSKFFIREMKMSADAARLMTALTTVDGQLPLGGPYSGILAHFANLDMWNEIAEICSQHDRLLTIYVDDITLSGDTVNGDLLWEIRKAIHRGGFSISKLERYRRGGIVTGVFVSENGLAIPNAKHKKLHELQTRTPEGSKRGLMIHGRRIDGLSAEHSQIRRAAVVAAEGR